MYVLTLECDGQPLRYWTGKQLSEHLSQALCFVRRTDAEQYIRQTWFTQWEGMDIVRVNGGG